MTPSDPARFAAEWAAAWNARDVEAVLAHVDDTASFTSPLAIDIVPGSNGRLAGKEALRRYWTQALDRVGTVSFVVEQVYTGIDHLVIAYRNGDTAAAEVLRFVDGRVVEGHGTYLAR